MHKFGGVSAKIFLPTNELLRDQDGRNLLTFAPPERDAAKKDRPKRAVISRPAWCRPKNCWSPYWGRGKDCGATLLPPYPKAAAASELLVRSPTGETCPRSAFYKFLNGLYLFNFMLTEHKSERGLWIDLLDPTPEEVERVKKEHGLTVPPRAALEEIESSSRLSRDGSDVLHMNMPVHDRR